MPTYQNKSGDSSVLSYNIENFGRRIVVRFNDQRKKDLANTYEYTTKSAGVDVIDQMKTLAKNGRGLNTFINKNNPRYERAYLS